MKVVPICSGSHIVSAEERLVGDYLTDMCVGFRVDADCTERTRFSAKCFDNLGYLGRPIFAVPRAAHNLLSFNSWSPRMRTRESLPPTV